MSENGLEEESIVPSSNFILQRILRVWDDQVLILNCFYTVQLQVSETRNFIDESSNSDSIRQVHKILQKWSGMILFNLNTVDIRICFTLVSG